MKRVFFILLFAVISISIFSCGSGVPQHCPAYSNSYHKITKQKTKGVNKNVMANGVRTFGFK